MKKSIKLLSVLLTVLMIFSSVSVGAFAAKASYQTVANLNDLKAYSPYGTVTRLSTEERMSILFDFLDQTLAPLSSLNMGKVIDVLGLTLTINLTSVDNIFTTIDDVCTLKSKVLYSIAAGIVDLGIVEDLHVAENTNWTKNMRRTGSQIGMVNNLLKLLSTNSDVIGGVFDNGIQLGMIANFISGIDLVPINALIKNLPALVNGIVLPLMGRQDDDAAQRNTLGNTGSDLLTVAQGFVNGLFTKPMSWTSYRVDASGNDLGYTMALPQESDGTSRYFVISADKTKITQFDYKYKGVLGGDPAGYYETVTYTKSETEEIAGSGVYLYKAPDNYNGDKTLKWYKADGKADNNGDIMSPYWLPSVKEAFEAGTLSLQINGTDSVAGLFYKFIPYIFGEMAPIVLNGSVKKAVAGAFDVTFEKIGVKGDAAVTELANKTGNPDNFFTKAQEYYTWEYSDYKVIDGDPYYRFQDEYFKGIIPENISSFYNMINWDYKIPADFMNKYIPSTVGGNDRILNNLNTFVYDLMKLFIADSWEVKGKTVTRDEVFPWSTANGNADLLNNLMVCARNVFKLAPEEILDEYYMDAQFYEPMMNGTLPQAVNGLICELVKLLMPQIKFADNIVDQPVIAIAAVVVREICTQLMPGYNFDAMLYTSYGNDASAKDRQMLAGKSSDYWLDTTLYMGVNLGMYYLRNLADIGEDSDVGYYKAMVNLGALPAAAVDGQKGTDAVTFAADSQYVGSTAAWLYLVDWVVDWALKENTNNEWTWSFERFVDCGATVDLATYQNPFTKLDTILLKLLPLDHIINVSAFNGTDYGSGTFVEKVLKDGIVDSIANLDVPSLLSLLKIPDGYLTQGKIADNLVKIVANLLNNIFYKVAGNTNLIDTNKVNSVGTLLNHTNIKNVVVNLISKLRAASETYNVLQPILPIVGIFVGWSTDPQKYTEPRIYFTNDWGSTYLKSDNNPVLKVTNASSGMLLKHRNSETVDSSYSIKITGVKFDNGVSTSQTFPVVVEPGETKDIALTVPNENVVTKATISYSFTGKDGQPLGGPQTKVAYAYVSNIADQLNENVAAVDTGDYATREAYKSYYFTRNIYNDVTKYGAALSFKPATVETIFSKKSIDFNGITAPDQGKNMNATASTYFAYNTSQSAANWPNTIYSPSQNKSPTSATGILFRAKDGVTEETVFPYGIYDMGQYAVKYGNKSATWEFDFVYYNDFDIGSVKDKYIGYNLQKASFGNATLFDAYETALRKVIELSDVAKRIDYVDTIQPQIEGAIADLDAAYKTLMESGSSSAIDVGDVNKVINKLDELETNPDRDINYQDYKLFEYFQYEKQRTSARAMIKSTTAPTAPVGYIDGEGASYDVIIAAKDAVANGNAAANAAVKAAITSTINEPTAEDMENFRQELENYVPAVHSSLSVDDQEAKLQYYYNFMTANVKVIDKTFINKEIAYAEAQNYDSSIYSADSWSRYQTALAEAKAVAADANASESTVFDAKYELMVAQNELLEKSKSMKESGYMDRELNVVIEQAQNVLDYYGQYYTLADGVTESDAFVQLIKALGVDYDVTVDGKAYDGILYNRSALTFQAYDRISSIKNKKAVDAIAEKVRAALKNFKIDVAVESSDTEAVKEVEQDVRFIQGITPGSITSIDMLLTKVHSTTGTTLTGAANEDGMFGTGATVTVALPNGATAAKYFVVIYGDVNGDGAVDGIDTFTVDKHMNRLDTLLNVYETAGDADKNGEVDLVDYSAISQAAAGYDTVSQTVAG